MNPQQYGYASGMQNQFQQYFGIGNSLMGQSLQNSIQPRCLECNEPGIHAHEFKDKIKEKKTAMKIVRDYVESHKDMLLTMGLIILADHFLFAGKFRVRIEQMVEQWIDKATAFKLKPSDPA